jgi:hypothetical protein
MDEHNRVKKIIFTIILVLIATFGLAQKNREKWEWSPGKCVSAVYPHPKSPFAVALFCEDALGTYMSVIHLGSIGAPASENRRWTLENRHWYDSLWSSDITGFKWAKDGLSITVSTSPIYGSGGYFEINLRSRTVKQLLPEGVTVSVANPGPGYDISGRVIDLH